MKISTKKLILILMSTIIIVIGIFLLWPKQTKPPKLNIAKSSKLPINFSILQKTDRFKVKNIYGSFDFSLQNKEWFITNPIKAKANTDMLEKMLTRLAGINGGILISTNPHNFKSYKLTPKKALIITFYSKNKILKTLYLGKSNRFTLIRDVDKNEVWQVKGSLRQIFVKKLKGWINPKLIPFSTKDIKQISYFNPKNEKVFSFEKDSTGKIKQIFGKKPQNFDQGTVTYSLIRFLKLRPSKIITLPSEIAKHKQSIAGYIEVATIHGQIVKYQIEKTSNLDVAVFNVKSSNWISLVKSHFLSHVMLLNTEDLISKLLIAVKQQELSGFISNCSGLEFETKKDKNNKFKVIKNNHEFFMAKSRLKVFLYFLERGKVKFKHMLNFDTNKDYGINEKSDFLTLIKNTGEKITLTFGKKTLSHIKIKEWRYVTISTKPNKIFLVKDAIIRKICRSKKEWQLKSDDMENIPAKKFFNQ